MNLFSVNNVNYMHIRNCLPIAVHMHYRCTQSLTISSRTQYLFVGGVLLHLLILHFSQNYMKGILNRLLCSHWLHVPHDYTICRLLIIYTFQNTDSETEKAIRLYILSLHSTAEIQHISEVKNSKGSPKLINTTGAPLCYEAAILKFPVEQQHVIQNIF